jgi:NADH dehydrogenase
MVAMRDVVAYAAAALDHPEAHGQILPVGGPQPVTWWDVVTAFERELGRELPVKTIAPGQPIPGVPGIVSELAAALAGYDSPLDMTELNTTYRVTPTPLADYVHTYINTTSQAA